MYKGFFIGHQVKLEVNEQPVSNIESLEMSIDGQMQNFFVYEDGGWGSNVKTGAQITISCSGRRDIGDPGNDAVFNSTFKFGLDAMEKIKLTFPDDSTIEFEGAINVTNPGVGATLDVAPLNFDIVSNKAVTFTPAPAATTNTTKSTSTTSSNA